MAGPPPPSWEVDPDRARAFALAPGVWQLRLPLPWHDVPHVNAYVLEREDGIVLVDCGSAGHDSHRVALERALAASGHSVGDVRLLVGTHTHSDHVGLAQWVIEASGCEFLMHADSEHFYDAIREPRRIEAARRARARREGVPEPRLDDFADVAEEVEGVLAAVLPTRPLAGGDTILAAGAEWEVVETPGHAPSHVSLLAPALGLAILGDVVAPAFVPWFDYGYSPDPVAEFVGSLRTLRRAGPFELALPGHGRAIEDLAPRLAEHEEGVEARLRQTLAAIEAGPATAWELARRVFGELSPPADFRLVDEAVSYLRHLRQAGLVEREEDREGRFVYLLSG